MNKENWAEAQKLLREHNLIGERTCIDWEWLAQQKESQEFILNQEKVSNSNGSEK